MLDTKNSVVTVMFLSALSSLKWSANTAIAIWLYILEFQIFFNIWIVLLVFSFIVDFARGIQLFSSQK